MATNIFTPSDPLFGAQWHLLNTGQNIMGLPQADGAYRNDINVSKVWPDYTGRGVRVGVIDDGVQLSHPDLLPNLLTSKFYNFDADRAGTPDGKHGTASIGLILAAQNDLGGVGVAFGSTGIGYYSSPNKFNIAAQRMLTDRIAVSSNSWGLIDRTDTTPFKFANEQDDFDGVLADLARAGRNGLGTATLFAGGNERAEKSNTLFDLVNNSAYVINVAAANADGTVASYSTPGPNILVAAPGSGNEVGSAAKIASIVTTDLLGAAGYNTTQQGNYTNLLDTGFNGTSAATPIASGVVALMLEANPNLGYRDIQEILAYSARTPDAVTIWKTNGATDWNGGGHRHNTDLGFGLIDARAAVRLAETWTKQSTFANLAKTTANFTGNVISVATGQSRQLTASFTEPLRVQHVAVSVEMNMNVGSKLSDVTLTLTGPNGTTRTALIDPAAYSAGQKAAMTNTLTYTFDTVQNWGEMGNAGAWTLDVTNASTTSRLDMKASITLLGDRASGGRTFIYTDDYARVSGADAARTVLSASADPNVLNMAAVSSDTTINLADRTAIIAGVNTRFGDTARFASLIAGDGNDRLVGTDAADSITGGRGDDILQGGGGADRLFGGQGRDALYGGADQDILYGNQDADLLQGNEGADSLYGGQGDDQVYGDAGEDRIFGEDGSDTLFGGSDEDIVYGDQGIDLIYGNQGSDSLYGGDGEDRIFGGKGEDRIFGDAGNDTLFGNLDDDVIYGNQGTDLIYGNQGADHLFGGLDADTIFGGRDADIVYGNLSNDIVYGNMGEDILFGGQGQDTLYGGQGADILMGGVGDDVLVGGLGADRYVFGAGSGRDLILGFNQAEGDRIALGGQTYTVSSAQNGDALLTLSGGGVIDLAGIRANQLNATYFAA